MNNGEAYAIIKQIESDKYTDSDKLEAINRVLGAETHNGITKDDLINAFKWFHGVMECYLSEKDMSDRQMQEICSEIDKYSGSGLTPERCAELAQAEREKGCEFCEDVPSRYRGIRAEGFYQVAADEVYNPELQVSFCPVCGKRLEVNHEVD